MSDTPKPGDGWSHGTTPGKPMKSPIPDELASGVTTDQLISLKQAQQKYLGSLEELAVARDDAQKAIAALVNGTALVNSLVSAVSPMLSKAAIAKGSAAVDGLKGVVSGLGALGDLHSKLGSLKSLFA